MTAGDPIVVHTPIPVGGYLEIKPPVGVVWMVKNLYFGGKWQLYRASSNGSMIVGSSMDRGLWINRTMIVTNEIFFSIKNTSTGSVSFGFDGLVIQ